MIRKKNAIDDEVLKRITDYSSHDPTAERRKLVELWKKHHPEAALEVSPVHHPLVCRYSERPPKNDPPAKLPDEEWSNDVYNVSVRRWQKDRVFGTVGGMIQLGISALDGTARHDWREYQAIKNQIAGPECEAFELYPAESRLLDPSNYYSLWCFPGLGRIKVGHGPDKAGVLDQDEACAPQRKLATKEDSK